MAFRIFDAEGRVSVDDKGVDRGLARVRNKVRETVERVDAMEGTAQLRADSGQLDKEIDKARQKLRSVDRQRATATADMDLTQFDVAEAKLRQKIKSLEREKVEIDVRMGRDLKLMDRTLTGVIQRLRGVGRATPWQDVQKLGNALHNARITLGPLSLSLRGLIVALLTLAPLVTAAAGAVGGLAAVVGQGLVGAVGLGGAALLGFGGLLGGVVAAVIAHKEQFNKFGHALRMVGAEFKRQTRIPKSFFDAIRSGIQTLRTDMPLFTRATNTALDTVGSRMDAFFRSLRTSGMRGTLKELFGNANEALGPLIDGLAALTRSAVRVGTSFSRHLAPVTRAFRDWSAGVDNATRHTDGLDRTVDDLMKSLKEVGRFLGASARLVADFFMAGGPAGRRMLRDITDLVDKWADFLETKEGQRAVTNFLNDSWDTVKKVAKVIEDLIQLVDNLASAGKPVLDWILDAADKALDLFNNLEDSTGAGDELVTALAGLVILRKAVGWTAALAKMLGGAALLGPLAKLGKGAAAKIVFPTGPITTGLSAALLAAFRTAVPAAAAVGLGLLANFIRGKMQSAFDSAGVPGVIKDAFTKAFDFTSAGQIGRIIEQVKHPIDSLQKAWGNLGKLPAVRLVAFFVDHVGARAVRTFNQARAIFRRGVELIGNLVTNIPSAARTAYSFARRLFGRGVDLVGHLVDGVTGAARSVFNRAKGLFNRGIDLVGHLVDSVSGPARSVFNRAKSLFGRGVDLVASLIDNILGPARSIMSAVEGIFHDISVNVGINVTGPAKAVAKFLGGAQGGVFPVGGYAAGAGPLAPKGDPVTPRMIERAVQAGQRRPDGGKVFAPKFLNSFNIVGEEMGNSEFVIPTNPAYRRRARMLLAQAAATIGAGFARGASAAGKHKKKPRRPKKVYSGHHYLAPVRALEDEIATKDNALTQLDSKYNTDARFKPMVDDDGQRIEANIQWHIDRLDELAGRAEHLGTLERQLANAIETAHSKLRNAMDTWGKRRPPATIVVGHGKNKKRVDNPEFKTWATKMEDLRSAFGEVPLSDAQSARFRGDDYDSEGYAYRGDIKEARATVSAPLSSGGMDAFLRQTGMFETLQGLNLAVAQAAATLGDPTDDRAAASSLAGFWESVINRIGPGGDKELLTEAYNSLAQARSGAADTGGVPDIGTQIDTFNSARNELFREFGSNYSPGGGIVGAIAGGVSRGVISGLSGSGGGSTTFGAASSSATPQKVVNYEQTNNFAAPPPDPHTFTKSTAWEVQAL